jgi:hypothetical protein
MSIGAIAFAAGIPVVPAPSPSDFLALSQSNHALQSQSLRATLARGRETEQRHVGLSAGSRSASDSGEPSAALRSAPPSPLRSSRSALLDSLSGSVAQSRIVDSFYKKIETRMVQLEKEHAAFDAVRAERADQGARGLNRLRGLLRTTTADSNRRNQELLNALQSTRQFVEELKAEYFAFGFAACAESDAYRSAKGRELLELHERLDALRLSQFESAAEVHQEQVDVDIIGQVHSGCEQHRRLVEEVFLSEARALEKKLVNQAAKYDAEVKPLVRRQEQAFSAVVAAKGRKLMALV